MKKNNIILSGVILFLLLSFKYSENFVEMGTSTYDDWTFKTIIFKRQASNNRIKVKYFAAKDYDGTSVPNRYNSWSYSRNIIAYSSGTYMNSYDLSLSKPVGVTIDNGVIVNRKIADFDGLVIVYATGGIVAANIDEGVTISGINRKLYIKNSKDKQMFMDWCEENKATVFQTHLLAYKNKLKIDKYSSKQTKRERRFLAVGKNDDGELQYVIIHSPQETSLYDGSSKVLDYLQSYEDMEDVIFLINLDTGAQDVSRAYNSSGTINKAFEGPKSRDEAVNLLVFYWD